MDLYNLPEVAVKLDGPVAIVTLDRAASRNAFTGQMKDSLVEIFARLNLDDRVRVILLTGAQNKGNAFCAGSVTLMMQSVDMRN